MLRPGPIYGSGDHKLTRSYARLMERRLVPAPAVELPHVHARDVAEAACGALANPGSSGRAYDITGPEDAPAVVLIHGIGLSRALWQWHLPALSQRYRVLRYDLPGHGDTPPSAQQLSLACLSRQLCDLLDRCGVDRAALVGFSLGGP